jgi:hypothetical protein
MRTAVAAPARSAEANEDAGPRKLTKAERKALKRQRMADEEHDDWWERGD